MLCNPSIGCYVDGNMISSYTKLQNAFLVILVISLKKQKKQKPNESSGLRSETRTGRERQG